MIQNDLKFKLIHVKSPFLEQFLHQCIESDLKLSALAPEELSKKLTILDLLWRYYERVKNYGSAANILGRLAEGEGSHFNLGERIEYLSRAVMCAKSVSVTGHSSDGSYLHDLQDKMEVSMCLSYCPSTHIT